MERTYIAIDLKSFYASVECRDRGLDPLEARLLVADESRSQNTICLAVSPALKALGIPGRCRLFEAQRLIAKAEKESGRKIDFIIAKPHMARYIEVSRKIYSIYLDSVSPDDIHSYSIDECFIDATSYMRLYNLTGIGFARHLISNVYRETGITATAGIGENLYLAKIAMDIIAKKARPDQYGARIASLSVMEYRKMLWDHEPITDFWRIGWGIANRLMQMNIRTIGDLARFSIDNQDWLYRQFGVDAELLVDHAWGIETCTMEDIKNYRSSSVSLSNGQVLFKSYTYQEARVIVREMTESLVLELVERGLNASAVSVMIGYDRDEDPRRNTAMDHYGRRMPGYSNKCMYINPPSRLFSSIVPKALEAYDSACDRSLHIRRINVTFQDLVEEKDIQPDLFLTEDNSVKEKDLEDAIVRLQGKYGKNALVKLTSLEECSTLMERNNMIGGHHR